MVRVSIIEQPIEVDRSLGVRGKESGAVLEFQGVVRAIEEGHEIVAIDYECHFQMATVQLTRIAEEVALEGRLDDLLVIHRTGPVAVGETSLYIRAVSAHRQAGFEALQKLINRLKEDVPIWKHLVRRSG